MNHIKHVLIDKDIYIYSYNFSESSIDSIKLYFNKSSLKIEKEINFNKSYVRELERIAHPEDIISVIKKKSVELEIIEERECDYLLVKYYDICITCEMFSRAGNGANIKKIWYEDGKCVKQCNYSSKYYIASIENHICSKCDTYTKINETFILCGCDKEGEVRSYKDGKCYLPENSELDKSLIDKANTQCYLEDGKTHNYCSKKYTIECRPSSSSGVLFPECYCEPGYTGKYCELKEGNINLEENMENILTNNIDETSSMVISNIRGIIFFLEKDGPEYIKSINDNYRNIYIDKSYNKLKNIVDFTKKTVPQIYDVLELAIYFLKYQIDNKKSKRNLQEDDEDVKKLNYIITHLHYSNYYGNQDINQEYSIQVDGLNLSTFLIYKKSLVNSENFKTDLNSISQSRIIKYIDINEGNDDEYIFVTLINSTLFGEIEEDNDFGIKAYFSTKNKSINMNLNNLSNITFYISSSKINFNYEMAKHYKDRKIDIYNKSDEAFVEPCYLNKLFDYDLTQKYRKNNIYQNIFYGSEICELTNFNNNTNLLIFSCLNFEKVEKIGDLNIGTLSIYIKNNTIDDANKVYNLPLKCMKKIDDLNQNIALWFFSIILILIRIY